MVRLGLRSPSQAVYPNDAIRGEIFNPFAYPPQARSFICFLRRERYENTDVNHLPALANLPVHAQAGCGLTPLKALTPLGCGDLIPICSCDSQGRNCRYTWQCRGDSGSSLQFPNMNGNSALDYVVPVPQIDVMGAMMKAEQIRQLHLQNQQIEQQLMATQQTAGPPPVYRVPAELAPTGIAPGSRPDISKEQLSGVS